MLGALVVVLVVYGLVKGLARLVVGVAALIAAFLVASRFDRSVAPLLGWTGASVEVRTFLAYLLLFMAVLVAGAVIGWLVRKVLKAAMLGWADRLAGAAVGLVAAFLAAALLVLPLIAYIPRGETLLEGSLLAPYVAVVADLAATVVPAELAREYRERVDALRRSWRGEGGREIVGTMACGRNDGWA